MAIKNRHHSRFPSQRPYGYQQPVCPRCRWYQVFGLRAADSQSIGLANTAAGQTSDQAMLKEILTEKYLGMVGQLEPFNDLRRTNNLIGIPKKSSVAPDIPQRLLYPQSEIDTNPNVPKPIPGLFVKTPVNS